MDRLTLGVMAFVLAYLLDFLIGDPPRFPHPVRILGAFITLLEKSARRLFISPPGLKTAGLLLVVVAGGGSTFLTYFLLAGTYHLNHFAGWILEIYILFTVLAGGDLQRHVSKVEQDLQSGNLKQARSSVALLVSRDTGRLDEKGVSRAALESLFENSADGLVAPLFFAAIGGAPLAVLYKAVNTLDSMLGYKTKEYIDLGFFSARLDDILSFIPARITAVLIILTGAVRGTLKLGLRTLVEDRSKHDSPNSAWPEAAAAGVLDLKLGGPDYYCGQLKVYPVINPCGKDAGAVDIKRGLALFRQVSFLAFLLFLFMLIWLKTWEVFIF